MQPSLAVLFEEDADAIVLTPIGEGIGEAFLQCLPGFLSGIANAFNRKDVIINLSESEWIDPRFWGALRLFRMQLAVSSRKLAIQGLTGMVLESFRAHPAETSGIALCVCDDVCIS